jgi:hypothetical protein
MPFRHYPSRHVNHISRHKPGPENRPHPQIAGCKPSLINGTRPGKEDGDSRAGIVNLHTLQPQKISQNQDALAQASPAQCLQGSGSKPPPVPLPFATPHPGKIPNNKNTLVQANPPWTQLISHPDKKTGHNHSPGMILSESSRSRISF